MCVVAPEQVETGRIGNIYMRGRKGKHRGLSMTLSTHKIYWETQSQINLHFGLRSVIISQHLQTETISFPNWLVCGHIAALFSMCLVDRGKWMEDTSRHTWNDLYSCCAAHCIVNRSFSHGWCFFSIVFHSNSTEITPLVTLGAEMMKQVGLSEPQG